MDIVWYLSEVALHEEECEVGDCLSNNLQATDGLLGQFIQAVVPKSFPIAFSQIQQVVLAETALSLILPHAHLQVAGCLRSH